MQAEKISSFVWYEPLKAPDPKPRGFCIAVIKVAVEHIAVPELADCPYVSRIQFERLPDVVRHHDVSESGTLSRLEPLLPVIGSATPRHKAC